MELSAQRPQRLHLRDHRRGTRLRRRRRAAVPVRAVRLHRDADRASLRRPVPAAAHRDRDAVGDGPGVHQRRLCGRAAPGNGSTAAADLSGRNINGDNAFDNRHHGERGASRTRGGGRAAGRARGPGQPAAAAAAAGVLCADPHRGAARPVAVTPGGEARQGRAQARPQARRGQEAQTPSGRPAGAALRASWRRPANG